MPARLVQSVSPVQSLAPACVASDTSDLLWVHVRHRCCAMDRAVPRRHDGPAACGGGGRGQGSVEVRGGARHWRGSPSTHRVCRSCTHTQAVPQELMNPQRAPNPRSQLFGIRRARVAAQRAGHRPYGRQKGLSDNACLSALAILWSRRVTQHNLTRNLSFGLPTLSELAPERGPATGMHVGRRHGRRNRTNLLRRAGCKAG